VRAGELQERRAARVPTCPGGPAASSLGRPGAGQPKTGVVWPLFAGLPASQKVALVYVWGCGRCRVLGRAAKAASRARPASPKCAS